MVNIIKGILCTCRSPCLSIHPSRKFAESSCWRDLRQELPSSLARGRSQFGSQNDTNIKITLSLPWNTFRNYKFTLESPLLLSSCICICIWFIYRWCSGKCQLPLYFPELSSIRGGSNSGRKVSNKRLGNSWLENSKCGASTSTGRNKVNTIKQTLHNITEKLPTALMFRQDKNNNIKSKQSKSKENKNYF